MWDRHPRTHTHKHAMSGWGGAPSDGKGLLGLRMHNIAEVLEDVHCNWAHIQSWSVCSRSCVRTAETTDPPLPCCQSRWMLGVKTWRLFCFPLFHSRSGSFVRAAPTTRATGGATERRRPGERHAQWHRAHSACRGTWGRLPTRQY